MSEEIIFCTRWLGEQRYEWFWHEADALGQEVDARLITSDQARETYGRHYDAADTYEVQPVDIEAENLDDQVGTEVWLEAWREMSLAIVLSEDDHVGTLQRFLVKSLEQRAEELAASRGCYELD